MTKKKCTKCQKFLDISCFRFRNNRKAYRTQCKSCESKYKKKYRKRNIKKLKLYDAKYYQCHRKSRCEYQRGYIKTLAGKQSISKQAAKRKRNFGWEKLYSNPFSDNTEIEWHHIDNKFVVALPKEIHRLFLGKGHRENLEPIVKQIYGDRNNDKEKI